MNKLEEKILSFMLVRIRRSGKKDELVHARAELRRGLVVFQDADGNAKAVLFKGIELWRLFILGHQVMLSGGGSIQLEE